MEKGNVWISFFHIEELFNHLTSSIIIRVYGLFGYPWHVIDINKIKFTQIQIQIQNCFIYTIHKHTYSRIRSLKPMMGLFDSTHI